MCEERNCGWCHEHSYLYRDGIRWEEVQRSAHRIHHAMRELAARIGLPFQEVAQAVANMNPHPEPRRELSFRDTTRRDYLNRIGISAALDEMINEIMEVAQGEEAERARLAAPSIHTHEPIHDPVSDRPFGMEDGRLAMHTYARPSEPELRARFWRCSYEPGASVNWENHVRVEEETRRLIRDSEGNIVAEETETVIAVDWPQPEGVPTQMPVGAANWALAEA